MGICIGINENVNHRRETNKEIIKKTTTTTKQRRLMLKEPKRTKNTKTHTQKEERKTWSFVQTVFSDRTPKIVADCSG